MVTSLSPAARSLYDAARTAVVVFDRADRGWLAVTGRDRASFLHGLFTNDITALGPGLGCYTAYLTPQGRMISDFTVYELGGRMLLSLDRSLAASMAARLDQLIFTEDVQVADATGSYASMLLVGPGASPAAAGILDGADPAALRSLGEHASTTVRFGGDEAVVLCVPELGVPGLEIVVPPARLPALATALAHVPRGDDELAERLRIEGGVPRFLRDMDTETIPLEAGIESRAISMTKGCYVGQEVIVRVLHRGHGRVAEKLVTLEVEGAGPPPPGTDVRSDDRIVGRVTSSTVSIALGRPIALACLQRDFIAPGTGVRVGGERAVVRETPVVGR